MEKRAIFIGADSAGYELKEQLKGKLQAMGYTVTDCGTTSAESCHYPDFARVVCTAVQQAPDSRFGLLICGTGIGMSMAANKHRHIRAALCSDTYSARMTRAHNDANVLCLGARVIGSCLAEELLDAFLSASYEGGRHATRVAMLDEIEQAQC
ncbi:MAG: ribose 5-phosphate isomerase B [Eubacteriales bacterium]